jgi:signal transduction histidine kinase
MTAMAIDPHVRKRFGWRSLRFRLLLVWILSLGACVAVSVLLIRLFQQTTAAQVARAEAVVARSCDVIRNRYAIYVSGWHAAVPAADDQQRRDLTGVVALALLHQEGVEGGIWQSGAGPLAYAFPTYPGSGPKTDLPAAERDQIEQVNQQAVRDQRPAEHRAATRTQTILVGACPLEGPLPGLSAWAMTRVQSAEELVPLQLGLAILMLLMVGMSAGVGRMLLVWDRHVRRIEDELGRVTTDEIPTLSRTGEWELDRVIEALNEAGSRLRSTRTHAEELAARVQRAERLAGLGRVAAGVAHEIRNPIAALRLQGENALAGDEERRRGAIGDMLGQVKRLEILVAELLAMTQRREPHPDCVELSSFLEACAARHRAEARMRGVEIVADADIGAAHVDREMVERILDNLLVNAVRHAGEGGRVRLSASLENEVVTIAVEDTGAGVPAPIRERLFEPFVTGRPDGTGLGLAIARELADAHGGQLVLRRPGGAQAGEGPVFALQLPAAFDGPCQNPDRRGR